MKNISKKKFSTNFFSLYQKSRIKSNIEGINCMAGERGGGGSVNKNIRILGSVKEPKNYVNIFIYR